MIIFIHGFGSNGPSSSTGKALQQMLPDQDVTKLTYDYLNPLSDVMHIIQYTNATDCEVTLVGVSLGGFVARYVASQCPNVDKLILLNPSINAPASLNKYEGQVVNGRNVIEGFSQAYDCMTVQQDNPELPIYVAVCSDDDVVDPNHTIALYQDRANLLITTGGHRIPFNEEVKAFINNALNVQFG